MRFLHLVWGNLKRKKARTILTFLSVAVAFLLFGFLAATQQALQAGVEVAGADRLVVRHKVSIIQTLPASYEARMERIEGVEDAVSATWFGGIYQRPQNFFPTFPVNPEEYLRMYSEFSLPEDQKEAWLRTRTGAIIGRTTADRFEFEVGDRIPLQSPIWPQSSGQRTWEFDVVGIYDGEPGTDTTQFLFRYDFFDEARPEQIRGQVGWYVVRVEDPEDAARVAEEIDAEFANSPAETKAETEGAFVQSFAEQVGNIGLIITSVLAAVFFTILLVAGNTMAQSVRERIGELAVLKAVGFTDGQVLGLVLAEAMLIAGVGGAFGLGLAWLVIAAGDPTGGALPIFYFPTRALFIGIALVFIVGFVTGILPALQAKQLRIADALRRL